MKLTHSKNSLLAIMAFTITGALIAFFSTNFVSSGFVQTQFFLATSQQESNSNIDRLEAFTETAAAIIQTPDFTNELDLAGATVESRKVAPYLLRISTTSKSPETSTILLSKILGNINGKSSTLSPFNQFSLVPVGRPSQAVYSALDSKILTTTGAILGFLSAIFLISIAKYLKL